MKIIFAQGNPGPSYVNTRHNVGFLCLDAFVHEEGGVFSDKAKFNAAVAETTITGEKVLFVKPTTFYNETGRSLRKLQDFYKCDVNDILVIHDELALPFGKIRVRHSGSDAGNNGIKSLNSHVGENYTRLRVGIWNELRDRMHDADFVLSQFNANEKNALKNALFPQTNQLIKQFIVQGLPDESFSLSISE
jgi:PTH1 family peptidyl-tRNA hydrolase